MADLLSIGSIGNIGAEHARRVREETVKKWNDLGFLDGLNDVSKQNIAQLLESQASTMINEVTEDNNGTFDNITFPIVRRVFSRLQGLDIKGVDFTGLDFKPMNRIKKHRL